MPEAKLVASEESGLGPADEGWFVLNAREARWSTGELGECCAFESREARFPQLGINLNRLEPGESMTMYHREKAQEGFLVALRHRTGVEVETSDPCAAYAQFTPRDCAYGEGWLPE